MSVKIKLKIKSGKGLIVGVDEIEVVDGAADFSAIQFTEGGEYVISAIPIGDSEFEETEFTINVENEEEVIPQEDPKEENTPPEGNRPIIAQIVQPTKKLKPIRHPVSPSMTDNADVGSTLGYVPFVWYNGTEIAIRDVLRFELTYDDLLPNCKLTFYDSLGLISSPERMPKNDSKFDIFLNSGSSVLKSIHLKFKIKEYQVNTNGSITMTGIVDVDDLYKVQFKSYSGTSFSVLKEITTNMGFGFNSNITDTDDSMKWLRAGSKTNEYLRQIINHAYISDESFLVGYFDFYWCFNFIDVEKEWRRDVKSDVGIISQGITSLGSEEKIVELVLTNDVSQNNTPFFFTNFKLNNNSTLNTTTSGTYTKLRYYDRSSKAFIDFNVDSQSGDTYKMEILKSDTNVSPELDNNFDTYYGGVIDLDNVHKNYIYALIQNDRNFRNLVSISAVAEILSPNYNLYKYQKVRVTIVNQKQTPSNETLIDERLSGEWMILDIAYIWSLGRLSQRITIARKELSKTKEELQNQVVEQKAEEVEINQNPEPEPTEDLVVVDSFEVGQVINVIDEKKEDSVILVTDVLTDSIAGKVIYNVPEPERPLLILPAASVYSGSDDIDIDSDSSGTVISGGSRSSGGDEGGSSGRFSDEELGGSEIAVTQVKPITFDNGRVTIKQDFSLMTPGRGYIRGNHKKEWICLHHTAGAGNPYAVFKSWEKAAKNVSTEFVVGGKQLQRNSNGSSEYDGVIVQGIPPGAWGYHSCLGANDKKSVGIEVCNYGYLTVGYYKKKIKVRDDPAKYKRITVEGKRGTLYDYTGGIVNLDESIKLQIPFRGYQYWHNYTEAQLISLRKLLVYISERDGIDIRKGLPALIKQKMGNKVFPFERLQAAYAAFDEISKSMVLGNKGIWNHTNTVKKTDMYPHPLLIEMLLGL